MPDLRLRPGQLNPSDIGLSPAEQARADVVLRPAAAPSDVGVSASRLEVLPSTATETHDGTGSLTLTSGFASAGAKADSGSGGTLTLAASLTSTGGKVGAGAGTLSASVALASTADTTARHGTGTLVTPATLAATGARIRNIGTVAVARPVCLNAAGTRGSIGAVGIAAGNLKLHAAGSARLNVGVVAISRSARIAGTGETGVIGTASITRRATTAGKGQLLRYVGPASVVAAGLKLDAVGYVPESHSGTGSLAAVGALAAAGVKGAEGTGTLTIVKGATVGWTSDSGLGRPGYLRLGTRDVLPEPAVSPMSASGVMGARGSGSLTVTTVLTEGATRSAGGSGALAASVTFAAGGEKRATGTGSLVASPILSAVGVQAALNVLSVHAVLSAQGTKEAAGTGTLVLHATMASSGRATQRETRRRIGGYTPDIRYPLPVRRSGSGSMHLHAVMWAEGVKRENDDDLALVLLLAA